MQIFWKALLWLSERPQITKRFLSIPAGLTAVPGLYVALLFLLHKALEESIVKTIEVQVPTWYWYVLTGVIAAWASSFLTATLHETDRRTLKRKAAGFSVVLAPVRLRSEPNHHATHTYGRVEPRGALVADLVATIHATHHLHNVTWMRVSIADKKGKIVSEQEITERFRGNVNRGDSTQIAIMSVYRPQDSVTGGSNGEAPYNLIGMPEMTPLPQPSSEQYSLTGDFVYLVTIELLHAGGLERANFTVDLSINVLEPIKLSSFSALVVSERPNRAKSYGMLFVS